MWNAGFNDFTRSTDKSRQQTRSNAYGSTASEFPTPGSEICKICDLSLGFVKEKIVGVVIAKEAPRQFFSKKDPSNERHVMNFTVRDSPVDFINATCWGSQTFMQDLSTRFHIGDVVEISSVTVQSKPMDGSDERFHPWTSSGFQLHVSESRTTVSLYTDWDINEYMALYHVPVKMSNDYCTLTDVLTSGEQLAGEGVNLLAAVRSVGAMKEMRSKDKRQLKRCEVKLLDEACNSFTLMLWDEEQIYLAQTWTPQDTVVFAADVRVKFDDFRKTMVATATSKTIFTTNPDTSEAHAVYQYAQTLNLPTEEQQSMSFTDTTKNIDLSSIQTVLTIGQCEDKQQLKCGAGIESGGVLLTIVYAFLSHLDIDGEINPVVYRCAKCHQRLDRVTNTCMNQDCPQGSRFDLDWADTEKTSEFEVRVSLSDNTGSLEGCYMSGDVCECLLHTTADQYKSLTVDQRTQLKWTYLLELCKVYIRISLPSFDRPKSSVRILSCELANQMEAAKFLH